MRPTVALLVLLPLLLGGVGCGRRAAAEAAARQVSEEGWTLFEVHRRAPDRDVLDRAVACLEEAAVLLEEDAEVRYRAGRAREERAEGDLALAHYRAAVAADAGHALAQRHLGALLLAQGEFAAAERALRAAIAAGLDDPELRVDLGQAHEERDQLPAARAEYERALAQRETYDDAWFRLSHLLRRLGEESAADEALAKFYQYNGMELSLLRAREDARRDPSNAAAFAEIGRLCFGLYRLDEAAEALEVAVRLDPEDADSLLGRAILARERGRVEEARVAADELLELWRRRAAARPDDADIAYQQGVAAMQVGHTDVALLALGRSIELSSDFVEARLARAQVLVESGRPEEAKGDYRAILATHPDHGPARESLEFLEGGGGR